MKKHMIYTGTRLHILGGELLVKRWNGHIVACDEYRYENDEPVICMEDRMLALKEIAELMREADGLKHSVVWEEPSVLRDSRDSKFEVEGFDNIKAFLGKDYADCEDIDDISDRLDEEYDGDGYYIVL